MVVMAALLAGSAGIVLCGASNSGTRPAASPQEAFQAFLTALARADAEAAIAASTAGDDESRMLRALAEFVRAALSFRDAFIGRYGKTAWDEFQDPERKQDGLSFHLTMPDADFLARDTDWEIRANGDEATLVTPDDPQSFRAVRTSRGWLVDPAGIAGSGGDPRKIAAFWRAVAAVLREEQETVGWPSRGPADIRGTLARRIFRLMGLPIPAPVEHRLGPASSP